MAPSAVPECMWNATPEMSSAFLASFKTRVNRSCFAAAVAAVDLDDDEEKRDEKDGNGRSGWRKSYESTISKVTSIKRTKVDLARLGDGGRRIVLRACFEKMKK